MVSVIVMGCCQRNSCPFGNPFIILGISRIRTTDLDTNAQNVTNGNFKQDVRDSLGFPPERIGLWHGRHERRKERS